MILQVYAIYDSKAKAFTQPFYAPNRDLACRYFANGANDPNLQLCKNSEDFTLFYIGEWNDEDSSFKVILTPDPVGIASNFKKV